MFKACFFRQAQHIETQEKSAGCPPALLLSVAIFILSILFFVLPLNENLFVTEEATGKILLALPISQGDQFAIRFTHSVNLSHVIDQYEWTGESILLKSTTFSAYGAGIPILADGLGTGFVQTEDGFKITGIDAPREKISMMLQTVPDHTLLYSDLEIKLLEYANSGTIVTVQVRRITLSKTVFGRL